MCTINRKPNENIKYSAENDVVYSFRMDFLTKHDIDAGCDGPFSLGFSFSVLFDFFSRCLLYILCVRF